MSLVKKQEKEERKKGNRCKKTIENVCKTNLERKRGRARIIEFGFGAGVARV